MVVQSKHFFNTASSLVLDSLQGLAILNPHLALDTQNKVVYLRSPDHQKVALVCGGGSGHEPSHASFVGEGILTAAVCGNVFASPSTGQVRAGIDLVDNEKGTVIIVKNYTGDILNFGLAKEQYAATHPDKSNRVKFVIVGDDVAVGRTQGSIVGRRGLAGTCLVYKIAGALAAHGGSLDEVYDIAQWVSGRLGTVGVGLEHCHVPGTADPTAHLGASELEIGLGIHNESGHKRESPIPPLYELIPSLIDMIVKTDDPERSFVPFSSSGGDSVVLLVNNLGGLSELELGAVVGEAVKATEKRGIKVTRVLSGSFMTSLNMPGFSLTLLLLPSANSSGPSKDLILSLLDAPSDAPGWKWSSRSLPAFPPTTTSVSAPSAHQVEGHKAGLLAQDKASFNRAVRRACESLVVAEPEITRMDSIAGDGDCGLTLKAGAEAVLKGLDSGAVGGHDIIGSAIYISRIAEVEMGGTSGALYSIFFSALAQHLKSLSGSESTASPTLWTHALTASLKTLYTYTRARPPSRTLVDPLAAFIGKLEDGASLPTATSTARAAAEHTRDVEAKAGRSAYVEGERLKNERVPDPGAWGIMVILEGLSDAA